MILIISFIPSFKINKVNLSPSFTALFRLTVLSNLFVTFEVKFLTNSGKQSLAKGVVTFVIAFFTLIS